MGFDALKLAIVPSVSLIVLSFISIILTTHYWILGDWIMGRWIEVFSEFPEKTKWPVDDVILDYTEPCTQATIASGCLNLTAGVMAIISWNKLKSGTIDTAFHSPLRRFYVLAVFITCLGGLSSAIASIATHYTDKGDDQYGCISTTGKTASLGQPFTNLMCTREIGACNFAKENIGMVVSSDKKWAAEIACNEAMAVKWLQIILGLNAIIIMGMFALQDRQRRGSRWPADVK